MMSRHHTFSARTETIRNLRQRLLALAIGGAISLTAFGAYGVESPRNRGDAGGLHRTTPRTMLCRLGLSAALFSAGLALWFRIMRSLARSFPAPQSMD